MPLGLHYAQIVFSDGTSVDLPADGVVALVGPNNSGKSVALRDLLSLLSTPQPPPTPRLVVREARLERAGTEDELIEWIEGNSFGLERADGRHFRKVNAGPIAESAMRNEWRNENPYFPTLTGFLVFFAEAANRLGLVGGSGAYDPINDAPSNPMQVLFARPDLEERISEAAHEAFGTGLTLSRIFGGQLDLFMGTIDVEPSIVPSREYIDAIYGLPGLQSQGDGIRSFMGIMLALITAQFRLVFVDEPEAFLHPPQARLLGRKLATEAPRGTQVFVATHDLDVLHGLLDPIDQPVTVVRLVRDGDVNRAAVLEPDDLREIWSDPLLRYSNVLEGIFHRGAVISESDSDSRFYAAVLDAMRDEEALPPHDLLFTQSGGKDRFPLVVRALRAADVPVAVIADFDVLREEQLLRRIVEALGAPWGPLQDEWRRVAAAISAIGTAPPVLAVKQQVNEILDAAPPGLLTRDDARRIKDATRVDDGWARVKQGGLAMVPQGEASEQARSLLDRLAALGLHVVPVGELERWVPEIGGHGPPWISEVLRQNRHVQDVGPARDFLRDLVARFA